MHEYPKNSSLGDLGFSNEELQKLQRAKKFSGEKTRLNKKNNKQEEINLDLPVKKRKKSRVQPEFKNEPEIELENPEEETKTETKDSRSFEPGETVFYLPHYDSGSTQTDKDDWLECKVIDWDKTNQILKIASTNANFSISSQEQFRAILTKQEYENNYNISEIKKLEPPSELPIIPTEEAPENEVAKLKSEPAPEDIEFEDMNSEPNSEANLEMPEDVIEKETTIDEMLDNAEEEIQQEIEKRGWADKFIKLNQTLSKLNVYNFCTKVLKMEIKSKTAKFILSRVNLSAIITAGIVGGGVIGLGGAIAPAVAPAWIIKRALTASGTTLASYNILRHREEKKSRWFTNEQEIENEIEANEKRLDSLTDDKPKTLSKKIYSTINPIKNLKKISLSRKINKLEEKKEYETLEKRIANDLEKNNFEKALLRLIEIQGQREADLLIDGINPTQDETYQRIENLKDKIIAENNLQSLTEKLEKEKQKNLDQYKKQATKKQHLQLAFSAAVGATVGSLLLWHDASRAAAISKVHSAKGLTQKPNLTDQTSKISQAKNITEKSSAPISKQPIVEWQPPKIREFQPLYLTQMTDATIEPGSGAGVIDALKWQLRAMPKAFGYKVEDGNVWDWAEKKANNLAFNQGYGDVLIKTNKPIAYVLESDGHQGFKIIERDPSSGKIIGAANKIDIYEYKKPALPAQEKNTAIKASFEPANKSPDIPLEKTNPPIRESIIPEEELPTKPGLNSEDIKTEISEVEIKPEIKSNIPTEPIIQSTPDLNVGPANAGQEIISNFPESPVKPATTIPDANVDNVPLPKGAATNISDKNIIGKESHVENVEKPSPTSTAETQPPETKIPVDLKTENAAQKFIKLLEIKKIKAEDLENARNIFTDYAKENLAIPNAQATEKTAKLFGQFFSQSEETLKEYLAESNQKNGLKNALNMYLELAEKQDLPEHFESWFPTINENTGEIFNVLKHGKIGGTIEYWLDSDGDGLADKIFDTEEQVKNFLTEKKSLVDYHGDINKEVLETKTGKTINAEFVGDLAKNAYNESRKITVDLVFNKSINNVEQFLNRIENLTGIKLSESEKVIWQNIYEQAMAPSKIKPVDKIRWFTNKIHLEIQRMLAEQ